MTDVYVVSDNIFSPLGSTTAENIMNLEKDISGVKQHNKTSMCDQPFYASLFDKNNFLQEPENYTRFEQMLIASAGNALKNSGINSSDPDTIFIISSTKGNISLLETEPYTEQVRDRVALHTSAKLIAEYFDCVHQPIVISNACISGILAVLTGKRLIQSGQYKHAVVVGADTISAFVLSGFQSFQAVSNEPCKPFDAARKGITLGEGAATIILSSEKKYAGIKIAGGSVSNDANHISGPSRTGEELSMAIKKALKETNISEDDIDFISSHGTATLFNDEMEAKAIMLAGLQKVPVNSLKGFYGHTLGAAGIIESVVSIHSLKNNIVFPTKGFDSIGVSVPLHISNQIREAPLKNILKTASGFGGCNAAVVICKQ